MNTIIRINKERTILWSGDIRRWNAAGLRRSLVRFRLQRQGTEWRRIKRNQKSAVWFTNYISYQLRSEMEVRTYLKDKEIGKQDRDLVVNVWKSWIWSMTKTTEKATFAPSPHDERGLIVSNWEKRIKRFRDSGSIAFVYREMQFEVGYHTAEKRWSFSQQKP